MCLFQITLFHFYSQSDYLLIIENKSYTPNYQVFFMFIIAFGWVKKNALFNVSLKSHESNICEDKLDIHCMIKNLGALKHYFEITVFYFFLEDWLLLSFFFDGGGDFGLMVYLSYIYQV